jgi:hypothetical protein
MLFLRPSAPRRVTGQSEMVVALHDAVQYCVGDGGIADLCMPVPDRLLAGDDRGFASSPVVDDPEQAGALRVVDGAHAPFIEYQVVCLGQFH